MPTPQAYCPLCGHHERTLVATWEDWEASLAHRDDGPMRLEAGRACGVAADAPDLMQCTQCASVGMSHIPDTEQLAQFYSHYHMTDGFVAKAKKKITRAQKRLLLLTFLAPRRKGGGKRRFLEIGASIGTAAEAARRMGFEPHALEIDTDAIEKGQAMFPKVSFIQGELDAIPQEGCFEILYGAEVIEHVPDPAAFLDHCHRLLVPGGVLFLTTPDCGHEKRAQPLLNWHSVKPPEHINLFTKAGMAALLSERGFAKHRLPLHPKPGMRVIARRG
ncbi:MAG: class I SAM-dependent methyltransferase [Pseudomonadota bacterium]